MLHWSKKWSLLKICKIILCVVKEIIMYYFGVFINWSLLSQILSVRCNICGEDTDVIMII